MGSPVEVIPGWKAINERLDSTLVQLNRLMHHYADVPISDDAEGTYLGRDPSCVSEECLETDIQDILRLAQTRLREFSESMGFKHGLPDQHAHQFQEAHEESQRSLAAAEHRISLLKEELARAQHDLANLDQKVIHYEDTIDQFREEGVPNIKQARELERAKIDLIEKTKEFADTLAAKEKIEKELAEYQLKKKQEIGREKMQKQRELRELKEKFQKEVLTATQQHLDREIELQEFCQKEKDAHSKTVEDMMTLHTEEVKKLKAEHAIKLEECCQNHASLESEWQDKEYELHKQLSAAVQERTRYIQLLFDEHLKVQALEVQLAGVQSDLSNEKLAKSQLESELKFMKVDVALANEKIEMGLKAQEHTKSILARVQDEMMDMKRTSAADLAKLEEKAFTLQKNLSCVTNTCVQSEHELHTQSKKVEELQKNVNIKQKDLIGATSELQKVQQEVQCLRSDLKAKDEDKKALQKNYEAQCQQLQTKIFKLQMEEKQKVIGKLSQSHECEDIVLKSKDNMETQLQRQAQQHQKYVQKLQDQFRMQGEEHTKNTSFNSRRGVEGMYKL